jgi:hypothetical protein
MKILRAEIASLVAEDSLEEGPTGGKSGEVQQADWEKQQGGVSETKG